MKSCAFRALAGLALVAALLVGAAWAGVYNVAATSPHWAATYKIIHWVGVRSVRAHAGAVHPPEMSPELAERGLADFDRECTRCHGAPGRAPEPFALGMTPAPPALPQVGREWDLRDIFWVAAYGVKMTGMPAFGFRLSEARLWAIAAAVKSLPDLTVAEYAGKLAESRARSGDRLSVEVENLVTGAPGASRGRLALAQYGCPTCHEVPGLPGGDDARAGPTLRGIATRRFIAGLLQNDDARLAAWIRNPQAIKPRTAMPDLGVADHDIRDMIAYLRNLP